MTLVAALALLAAGLLAGVVNALAGGGSLITFPALLAVGLAPVPANVTNSLAVCPGYLGSVAGSRTDLVALARHRGRASLLALVPTALAGTGLGCALLLATPSRAFTVVVPFLVLGATAALAFAERLARAARGVRARADTGGTGGVDRPGEAPHRRQRLTVHIMVGLGAVYGGYFGAALGIMLVAGLGLALPESLARISALKNAVSAVVGLGTVVAFAVFGPVHWAAVAVLAPATVLGGYAGARLVRRLPPRVLRALIVGLGTVVGLVLLVRAFA
jgi:uncharacterized protein